MTISIASPARRGARRRTPLRLVRARSAALSREEMWAAFARSEPALRRAFRRGGAQHRDLLPALVHLPQAASRARRVLPDAARRRFPPASAPASAAAPSFRAARPRPSARMAERALAYMRAHHEEPLALAAIARALAMSPSHFARRFRAAAGVPPMRALADLRVERGAGDAGNSRPRVLEVALACGFGSASAMVRAFRRQHRHHPAAWRARRMKGGRS
jgi:AraC-like DNA-binding protein